MRIAKNASPAVAIQQEDPAFREDVLVNDEVLTTTIPLAIANIALDVRSPLPLHEQICQAIRSAIWAGELPPKTLLPTTRELARHLGVARNTVVFAYARLAAEGLCVSNTRRGTRVASDLQQRPSFSEPNAEDASVGSGLLRVAFQAKSAMELPVDRSASGAPFAGYTFDPVQYPRTKLGRRLADKFLGAPSTHQFGSSTGRFQSTITDYLRQARGVMCDPSQVIAVSGLEGALDLVARVLVDPGDSVAIEDPCADFVHSVFRAAKAYVRPIPSDAFGADPKRMSGPPARLLYVSPSVSFPFGLPMPSARRQEILAAARAQNALIIENDSCFELRYSGASLYSIQGQDRDGRVIHYGGFPEVLGESVRVGYLVVPATLLDTFLEMSCRAATPPVQIQDALAEFVETHEFSVHARTVRGVYARRLDLVRNACKEHLKGFPTSEPLGGLYLVIYLNDRGCEARVSEAAQKEGIPVRPLSRYFLQNIGNGGLVLGFGSISERAISPMIKRLGELCAAHEQSDRLIA